MQLTCFDVFKEQPLQRMVKEKITQHMVGLHFAKGNRTEFRP